MKSVAGLIRHSSDNRLYRSRGDRIERSVDGGITWLLIQRLPGRFRDKVLCMNRFLMRASRLTRMQLLEVSDNQFVIVWNGNTYYLDGDKGLIEHTGQMRARTSLKACFGEGLLFYGEYIRNGGEFGEKRLPVHIYCSGDYGRSWSIAYAFSNVRHVHGVYYDPFSRGFWVTTGDRDNEAGLWYTSRRFADLDLIVGGSQIFRIVEPLFSMDYVLFGSDSPTQPNHIYRFCRKSGNVERLQSVSGTVFFGHHTRAGYLFGTTVEPMSRSSGLNAEVWFSKDGNDWSRIAKFRKDRCPMRLFQYGQVSFPSGPGNHSSVWVSPIATSYDQRSVKIGV
jgi:hypothetical protein